MRHSKILVGLVHVSASLLNVLCIFVECFSVKKTKASLTQSKKLSIGEQKRHQRVRHQRHPSDGTAHVEAC